MLKYVFTIIILLSLTCGKAQTWGNNGTRTETRNDAGAQGSGVQSGFFETNAPVNFPVGATGWWHLLDVRYSVAANNYAMQFSGSFFNQDLWFRKTNNSATQQWSRILTEFNSVVSIGTGAGAAGLIKIQDESNTYSNYVFGSMASANYRSGLMLQSNGSINQALVGNPAPGFAFRWLATSAGSVNYYDDTYEKMRLTMDGWLGIGTTGPKTKLHVVKGTAGLMSFPYESAAFEGDGDHKLGVYTSASSLGSSTGSSIIFGNSRATNTAGRFPGFEIQNINAGTAAASILRINYVERNTSGTAVTALPNILYVLGNGNIGIGTTSANDANYKLFVELGIHTRKIKVDQATWSDYVFDNNYRLRAIKEVEQFIKKNKHLPDVPSAAEVEREGLNLGDGQAMLLRKIEELTLYVIELKKENEQQTKEIKVLKERMTNDVK